MIIRHEKLSSATSGKEGREEKNVDERIACGPQIIYSLLVCLKENARCGGGLGGQCEKNNGGGSFEGNLEKLFWYKKKEIRG